MPSKRLRKIKARRRQYRKPKLRLSPIFDYKDESEENAKEVNDALQEIIFNDLKQLEGVHTPEDETMCLSRLLALRFRHLLSENQRRILEQQARELGLDKYI